MKQKLLQTLYDIRTQPVVAVVTIIGTAISIFLIMIVVMMQQAYFVPFSPESKRPRMLHGRYMHIQNIEGVRDMSSALSYSAAIDLYDGLEGVEITTIYGGGINQLITIKGDKIGSLKAREVDANFFRVFDHKLLAGRTVSQDEVDSRTKVAVICQSAARNYFGSVEDAIGDHILLNYEDYEVIGVVADNPPLATNGYGEAFIPVNKEEGWNCGVHGPLQATMLVKPGVGEDDLRPQIKGRYAELDTKLAADGYKTVFHEAPFTQEVELIEFFGSNTTPDFSSIRRNRLITYLILLLVPAINLSSMLHSRLRQRVSQIGLRRAFGCTRRRIITDIIIENLLITLAGGIIGLIAATIFGATYDGLLGNMWKESMSIPLTVFLDWRMWGSALLACLILNIISASIPAWIASRINPAEAIKSSNNI